MDVSVSNAVSASMYMNQAQTAQQVQTHMFKEALDNQSQQVSALMESVSPQLAQEGSVGTNVNTFA